MILNIAVNSVSPPTSTVIHGAQIDIIYIYSISGLSIQFLLARRTNSQLHALFSLYALGGTQYSRSY